MPIKEEEFLRLLRKICPIIALGKTFQITAPLCVAGVYIEEKDWKRTVKNVSYFFSLLLYLNLLLISDSSLQVPRTNQFFIFFANSA